MGDHKDHQEKTTTSQGPAQDGVVSHRKPLPKGSNGSKPVAHARGQKPKPKRSGAMHEAHQARRDAEEEHLAHHTQALFQNELSIDSDSPTGNLGIDSGGMGVCAKGGQGCFLKPMQRMMLISDFHSRLGRVEKTYSEALGDCRLTQVLKKTDEMPWYLTLLMGAAFSALESAITVGVKALKVAGAATHAVADATKSGAVSAAAGSLQQDLKAAVEEANLDGLAAGAAHEIAHDAEEEVRALADKRVETIVKTSLDKAKEKSTSLMTSPDNKDSKETNQKNSAIGYIDHLRHASSHFFQQLSEGPPGTATDAELLALWRSLDDELNPVEMYRQQIDDAIERYLNSPVSEMGRSTDWDGMNQVEKEVRVAWLITKGGGKRLIYMDRLFDAWYQERQQRLDHDVQRSDAYDAATNRLSLSQEADWTSHKVVSRHSETPIRDDQMLKFVEPEFKEMALQKQKKIWLSEPETFMEDWDHQVAYGVPSIKKVAGS